MAPFPIPESELIFSFARSSGPGGQNVNKVNSKAILRWNPSRSPSIPADVRDRFLQRFAARLARTGEVVISSDRHRDQSRNRQECRDKLRAMLAAVAHAPLRRKKALPSRASALKAERNKRRHSEKKANRRKIGENRGMAKGLEK